MTTAQGLSNDFVRTIYQDRAGRLWIGTDGGLDQLVDGRFINYTTRQGLPPGVVLAIYEDRQSRLWIGTQVGNSRDFVNQPGQGGLAQFRDGRFDVYTGKDGLLFNGVSALLEDRDGNLWIGAWGSGLYRLRDGKFASFTKKDKLSNDAVTVLYEDREGSLWVGTDLGGLNRLRDGQFTPYTRAEGLPNESILGIYEDRAGSIWIGHARWWDGPLEGRSDDQLHNARRTVERPRELFLGRWRGQIVDRNLDRIELLGARTLHRLYQQGRAAE